MPTGFAIPRLYRIFCFPVLNSEEDVPEGDPVKGIWLAVVAFGESN